jgi:dipeptidase E
MTPDARQIIALGGGGFSMEPDNLALDRYVLSQARMSEPRVAFLPTASGDSDSYVARFYAAFEQLPCTPTHVPLFRRTPDLREQLLAQDVLYIGGGNTRSMLAVWREWSIPEILRQAWSTGTVLAGISAGAICWFEHGVTDSHAGHLTAIRCLGFLPGSFCPHYDGEPERRPGFLHLMKAGRLPAGVAADDGAAVHYRGTEIHAVVTSRPGVAAYRVGLVDREVREDALPARMLRTEAES